MTDRTHDPSLRSWVESANDERTDFPIQNLPFGRFRRARSSRAWRIGVAIGDQVLDLRAVHELCPWDDAAQRLLQPLAEGDLNRFMAMGPVARRELRALLSEGLREGSNVQRLLEACLVPQSGIELTVPCRIGDYTDFYAGIHHATTVGKLFRPDNPLLPNYKWVPIAYHGRSSSIVVSGHRVRRPLGQTKGEAEMPQFGPSKRLDYELEVGALVGVGNTLGEPIPMAEAEAHLFGLVLLNDWSARDIQSWEYQPLGPFLSKSFGSTISPWVVTMEALEPFRRPFLRAEGDPQPLPYLDSPTNRERGSIDIRLEVLLQTQAMRERGEAPHLLTQGNFRDAYWTVAQMLAHHASNGCNLQPGDLFGSGTQSGPEPGQGGSLLELSHGGKVPVQLPGGETRVFLLDGDSVWIRGRCEASGARAIGFGECMGTVSPSP
ncbi:MAG TPA: fumarylacetoacetase [Burkholderiaceae bacterium]|nr:fumarylacetoacetase [Burkholderiaceae bacterium]